MRTNYHTHTYFCGHARGNASDYVKEAIKHGFTLIGISDHAPNSRVKDINVRMKPHQLDDYLKDIEVAQANYPDITVLKGIEVEYFDDHEDYYRELRSKLDYMIHGQHYISMNNRMDNLISGFALSEKAQIYRYSDYLVKAMESNHFDILAHPDLYMCGYVDFDEHAAEVAHIICKKAKETNTVLEYNANGYRRGMHHSPQGVVKKYPRDEFWKIARTYDIKVVISSDCHKPDLLHDETLEIAEEDAHNLGLQIIDKIELKNKKK